MATKQTEKKSTTRLAQIHYKAARNLECMYRATQLSTEAPRHMKHKATLYLNRLAKDAGINTEDMRRGDIYLAAIRALIASHGSDASYPARMIQTIAEEWNEESYRLWEQGKAAKATAQTGARKGTTQLDDEDHTREVFGMLPGDTLEYEDVNLDDVCAGDLLLVWDREAKEWLGLGRFVAACDEEFKIQESDSLYTYRRKPERQLCRITGIVRRIPIERGSVADVEQSARRVKLEGLKRRLEKLDDLEHEGMRFRVTQEIRDLENAADVDGDEWPDVIGAESEAA
jgi:hypothetical protein